MEKKFAYILIIILFGHTFFDSQAQIIPASYTQKDSIRIENLLKQLSNKYISIEKQILRFGLSSIGTPYVGGTLEKNEREQLIINVHELDCTTFVETVLALTLTTQENSSNFRNFCANLQEIRYRNGNIDKYPSRLHYFSDWIQDNIQKGIIREVTPTKGSITKKQNINFMSSHADKYPPIAKYKSFLKEIRQHEKRLTKLPMRYIPKDSLALIDITQIHDGDIIAITTSIEGLDVSHVGLAYFQNRELHLLHASLGKKQVIIEDSSLNQQLQRYKSQSGIRVLRIIDKKEADKK